MELRSLKCYFPIPHVAKRQPGRIFARNALLIYGDPEEKSTEGFKMAEDLEQIEPGAVPVEEAQGEPDNGMLHKTTVSKIVERERQKAFEKGKQEALMQMQQEQQQMQQPEAAPVQQATQAPQQPGQLGGMQQMTQADIERIIAERTPQALQEHVNNLKNEHEIHSFVSKMQAAEARHPGLETKLNDLDYSPAMAKIIGLANNMENTADIMKELIDNPMKMGNVMMLMEGQPKMAQKAMMELSNSIKTNQDALSQEKQAQDPMSQLKPSSSAGMDNSAMSVTDFRKMFRT
jgi:hypothetical protein